MFGIKLHEGASRNSASDRMTPIQIKTASFMRQKKVLQPLANRETFAKSERQTENHSPDTGNVRLGVLGRATQRR
jgi:hypothetical protein